MTKHAWIVIGVVLLIGVVGSILASHPKTTNFLTQTITPTYVPSPTAENHMKSSMSAQLIMKLNSINNSSESGTATIQEENEKVIVTIDVKNEPGSASQPAHFHTGTCTKPGSVVYPLKPVILGKSVTKLSLSLDEFTVSLPLILNIHKSSAEIGKYVSCGELAAVVVSPVKTE